MAFRHVLLGILNYTESDMSNTSDIATCSTSSKIYGNTAVEASCVCLRTHRRLFQTLNTDILDHSRNVLDTPRITKVNYLLPRINTLARCIVSKGVEKLTSWILK